MAAPGRSTSHPSNSAADRQARRNFFSPLGIDDGEPEGDSESSSAESLSDEDEKLPIRQGNRYDPLSLVTDEEVHPSNFSEDHQARRNFFSPLGIDEVEHEEGFESSDVESLSAEDEQAPARQGNRYEPLSRSTNEDGPRRRQRRARGERQPARRDHDASIRNEDDISPAPDGRAGLQQLSVIGSPDPEIAPTSDGNNASHFRFVRNPREGPKGGSSGPGSPPRPGVARPSTASLAVPDRSVRGRDLESTSGGGFRHKLPVPNTSLTKYGEYPIPGAFEVDVDANISSLDDRQGSRLDEESKDEVPLPEYNSTANNGGISGSSRSLTQGDIGSRQESSGTVIPIPPGPLVRTQPTGEKKYSQRPMQLTPASRHTLPSNTSPAVEAENPDRRIQLYRPIAVVSPSKETGPSNTTEKEKTTPDIDKKSASDMKLLLPPPGQEDLPLPLSSIQGGGPRTRFQRNYQPSDQKPSKTNDGNGQSLTKLIKTAHVYDSSTSDASDTGGDSPVDETPAETNSGNKKSSTKEIPRADIESSAGSREVTGPASLPQQPKDRGMLMDAGNEGPTREREIHTTGTVATPSIDRRKGMGEQPHSFETSPETGQTQSDRRYPGIPSSSTTQPDAQSRHKAPTDSSHPGPPDNPGSSKKPFGHSPKLDEPKFEEKVPLEESPVNHGSSLPPHKPADPVPKGKGESSSGQNADTRTTDHVDTADADISKPRAHSRSDLRLMSKPKDQNPKPRDEKPRDEKPRDEKPRDEKPEDKKKANETPGFDIRGVEDGQGIPDPVKTPGDANASDRTSESRYAHPKSQKTTADETGGNPPIQDKSDGIDISGEPRKESPDGGQQSLPQLSDQTTSSSLQLPTDTPTKGKEKDLKQSRDIKRSEQDHEIPVDIDDDSIHGTSDDSPFGSEGKTKDQTISQSTNETSNESSDPPRQSVEPVSKSPPGPTEGAIKNKEKETNPSGGTNNPKEGDQPFKDIGEDSIYQEPDESSSEFGKETRDNTSDDRGKKSSTEEPESPPELKTQTAFVPPQKPTEGSTHDGTEESKPSRKPDLSKEGNQGHKDAGPDKAANESSSDPVRGTQDNIISDSEGRIQTHRDTDIKPISKSSDEGSLDSPGGMQNDAQPKGNTGGAEEPRKTQNDGGETDGHKAPSEGLGESLGMRDKASDSLEKKYQSEGLGNPPGLSNETTPTSPQKPAETLSNSREEDSKSIGDAGRSGKGNQRDKEATEESIPEASDTSPSQSTIEADDKATREQFPQPQKTVSDGNKDEGPGKSFTTREQFTNESREGKSKKNDSAPNDQISPSSGIEGDAGPLKESPQHADGGSNEERHSTTHRADGEEQLSDRGPNLISSLPKLKETAQAKCCELLERELLEELTENLDPRILMKFARLSPERREGVCVQVGSRASAGLADLVGMAMKPQSWNRDS